MARSTVLFIMINLFHEYKRDKENPQVKSAKEGEFVTPGGENHHKVLKVAGLGQRGPLVERLSKKDIPNT